MALPVMSFASGATNSMRGAAFLSGLADAMVVDVGGTSSDVGQLRRGFPREANSVVEIGEVRTLFRMPDLYSIGLGGGSIVRRDPLTVWARTVSGTACSARRCVFGGATLTATDMAVAAGIVEIGDKSRVADIPAALAGAVLDLAQEKLEDAIDRMKTEAGEVPLIAVGGGAFLVPDQLAGVSEVDPRAAWRLRQRRRRGDRPDQRRDRPDLSRHDPSRTRSPPPRRRRSSAPSRPGRTAPACKRSKSRTCPSPICPGTRSACASASPARSVRPADQTIYRFASRPWCGMKPDREGAEWRGPAGLKPEGGHDIGRSRHPFLHWPAFCCGVQFALQNAPP